MLRRLAAGAPFYTTAHCASTRSRTVQDHKATDACEKARVEAAGGFVIRKRVMGVLAVARSFGDFVLKKYVPAEPYTSTTKLDAMVGGGVREGTAGDHHGAPWGPAESFSWI